MKIKKFLIFLLLILLTGCSNEYTLEISNNKFNENIDAIIPKSLIPTLTDEYTEEIEFDDQFTPFIKGDTASLITNDKFYKKKVIQEDDYFKINMNYVYNEETFSKANSINTCFEYPKLDFSNNYYINLQGGFYCLYGDYVDIKIKTKNKVYFNNADDVSGDTYIWHIDENNSDYVDIRIEVDKGISQNVIIGSLLIIVIAMVVVFLMYKFYKKNKDRNSI